MRHRIIALAAVATLAIGATAVAAGAQDDPLPQTVSITVELDLPFTDFSDGPVVFAVTDVPVIDGPELTGADLVDNPSDWCGGLAVDVDNVAKTITITPDPPCDFQTASVTVTGEGIDTLEVVSDTLWQSYEEEDEGEIEALQVVEMILSSSAANGVAQIDWVVNDETGAPNMNPEGAAVFAYGDVAPPPPPPPPPPVEETAPAEVVQAAPRFTG